MEILDLAVCFFLAAVVGTGVGGGGLFLVYMTGWMGFSQITAQAVNLFYFLAAAFPATLARVKGLPWRLASICTAAGIPGVFLGSAVRDLIHGELLGKCFGAMLVASGAAVFLVREKP